MGLPALHKNAAANTDNKIIPFPERGKKADERQLVAAKQVKLNAGYIYAGRNDSKGNASDVGKIAHKNVFRRQLC